MKQEGVDESEYCRGRADSEGQCQDCENGEDSRSAQAANGKLDIAEEVVRQVEMLVHHKGIATSANFAGDQEWLSKVKICKRKARPEPGEIPTGESGGSPKFRGPRFRRYAATSAKPQEAERTYAY